MQKTLSFDIDDTLNWMTRDIVEHAGLDYIPKFDDIKAGNVPPSYEDARAELFPDYNFWKNQAKTDLADWMIQEASEANFKPILCTKTPMIRGQNLIVAAKVEWAQENYPELDMLIATGQKHSDSVGLVDDSFNNCMKFNAHENLFRPVLVWDNSRPHKDVFKSYLRLCQAHTISHLYNDSLVAALVVVKERETGRVLAFNRSDGQLGLPCGAVDDNEIQVDAAVRELREETGLVLEASDLKFTGFMKAGNCVVSTYYAEIEQAEPVVPEVEFQCEGEPEWVQPSAIRMIDSVYTDFNRVLFYNLGLI